MITKLRTSVAARHASPAAKLLLAVGALGALAACGQKGPLYLPAEQPLVAAPAASAAAPAAAAGTGAAR